MRPSLVMFGAGLVIMSAFAMFAPAPFVPSPCMPSIGDICFPWPAPPSLWDATKYGADHALLLLAVPVLFLGASGLVLSVYGYIAAKGPVF